MRELEELERRFEEEREAAKREARTKVLLDFERNSGASSSSLASSSAAKGVGSSNGVGKSAPVTIAQKARSSSPTLSSLPARIAEATRAAEDAAMAALAEEQAQAARAKFPSYWVPSLTPDLSNHQLSAENLEIKRKERAKLAKPRCLIGGEPGHATSTKQLVGVKFARSPDGERNICPSCRKGLSNASHLHVLRRCGHVYCALCISTLVPSSASSSDAKKDKASERESDAPAQCPECDTRIKVPTKDILKLHKEGTGHIGAGGVEVTKKGLAFLG
ncbi:Uncharacterized conserved protein [Ceraceosorus bombacis]|uniref:Uncharacterized conserved protein n=1 Tax=Ceraceosorus bombacis TaxID=401625 RepID=A0A0P1BEB6_9BASI|nr:Uncharacterized conserved protein [Ceraceosorus bombacis]